MFCILWTGVVVDLSPSVENNKLLGIQKYGHLLVAAGDIACTNDTTVSWGSFFTHQMFAGLFTRTYGFCCIYVYIYIHMYK